MELAENKDTAAHNNAEADNVMTDELIDRYTRRLKDLKPGVVIKGNIVSIGPVYVTVDVGCKSEGRIRADEFLDISQYKPGDEVSVFVRHVENRDGSISLSKQEADRIRNWGNMVSAQRDGTPVTGRIVKKVRGGYLVDAGMEAFLPSSQVDVRPVRDQSDVIGKIYEFKVVKVDEKRRNIVLSRRNLLEEEQKRGKEELLKTIKQGDIKRGVVKNITDFGAFVDIKGIDGLLHITDITWGRISHPSELLAVGDEIDVVVLNIDREREKVSLGMKQITPDPWDDVESKYPAGSRVKGRVVNILQYGAFVELEKGVEGLIHVSELSWTKRINNASDVLGVGDVVDAMVLSANREQKRISLGLKQIEPNPWDKVPEKYPVGSTVTGKVRNLTSYGAFVELEDGIDGLIHISDMSWVQKVNSPSDVLNKGDMVTVKVLNVDGANQRIALGLKQMQADPWDTAAEKYVAGSAVSGMVTKVAPFGVFVELEPGIEGLLHSSQLSGRILKEGDSVTAVVMSVSQDEKKIALTIKDAGESE